MLEWAAGSPSLEDSFPYVMQDSPRIKGQQGVLGFFKNLRTKSGALSNLSAVTLSEMALYTSQRLEIRFRDRGIDFSIFCGLNWNGTLGRIYSAWDA